MEQLASPLSKLTHSYFLSSVLSDFLSPLLSFFLILSDPIILSDHFFKKIKLHSVHTIYSNMSAENSAHAAKAPKAKDLFTEGAAAVPTAKKPAEGGSWLICCSGREVCISLFSARCRSLAVICVCVCACVFKLLCVLFVLCSDFLGNGGALFLLSFSVSFFSCFFSLSLFLFLLGS